MGFLFPPIPTASKNPILNPCNIVDQLALQLIFKIINGLSDLNFEDYFTFRRVTYNIRGNTKKIDTIYNSKNPNWINSFFVRGARLWNLLPDQICNSKTFNELKTKINNYDLSPHITQFLN